jgi:hypothetical protein
VVVGGVIACPFTGGVGCAVTVGAIAAMGGAAGGGAIGYLVGSDRSADWDARIMLYPYDGIKDLKCTYMEGKSGRLQVMEKS